MYYDLPVEYTSLPYLRLGCVKTVKYICMIWNNINIGNTVRIKEVNERESTIIVTGVCENTGDLVEICKYLTTVGVQIKYDKTTLNY